MWVNRSHFLFLFLGSLDKIMIRVLNQTRQPTLKIDILYSLHYIKTWRCTLVILHYTKLIKANLK